MPSYNRCAFIGNLTRDPEVKNFSSSNSSVTNFGIAVNRKWSNDKGEQQEEVVFIDCSAWNRTGELVSEHLSKGDLAMVEGRLEQQNWNDSKTGDKRSKHVLVVQNVVFLNPRNQEEEDSKTTGTSKGSSKAPF